MDDPKLSSLLKEWEVAGAPPSLDVKVLNARRPWWNFLIGSIRIPVPVLACLIALAIIAGSLVGRTEQPPQPHPINLVDFQPVRDLNVRIIRGGYEPR